MAVHNAFRRILIVKLADLGDLLTATPALRVLRQTFPEAQIDLLTTPLSRPLLDGSPLLDRLIDFDKFAFDRPVAALHPVSLSYAAHLGRTLRRNNYDALLILHHLTTAWGTLKYRLMAAAAGAPVVAGLDNGRGGWLTHRAQDMGFGQRHEVEYWLSVAATLGATTEDTHLELVIRPQDEVWARQQMDGDCDKEGAVPWVAIHPGSGGYSPARRWPAERFAQVADVLIESGLARVILVGTRADGVAQVRAAMRQPPNLDMEGCTSLGQLAALLKRCNIFIGADSGVMHIAAAAGTRVIALFGPSNHRAWGPWTEAGHSTVVRLGLACSPCLYVGSGVGLQQGCGLPTCMSDITPQMVLAAFDRLTQTGESAPPIAVEVGG